PTSPHRHGSPWLAQSSEMIVPPSIRSMSGAPTRPELSASGSSMLGVSSAGATRATGAALGGVGALAGEPPVRVPAGPRPVSCGASAPGRAAAEAVLPAGPGLPAANGSGSSGAKGSGSSGTSGSGSVGPAGAGPPRRAPPAPPPGGVGSGRGTPPGPSAELADGAAERPGAGRLGAAGPAVGAPELLHASPPDDPPEPPDQPASGAGAPDAAAPHPPEE